MAFVEDVRLAETGNMWYAADWQGPMVLEKDKVAEGGSACENWRVYTPAYPMGAAAKLVLLEKNTLGTPFRTNNVRLTDRSEIGVVNLEEEPEKRHYRNLGAVANFVSLRAQMDEIEGV